MRIITIGAVGLLLASAAWARDSDKTISGYGLWTVIEQPTRPTPTPTPIPSPTPTPTPTTNLASPEPLTAAITSNRVSLAWGNINSETGFLIERRRQGDQRFSEIAKTTTNVTTYTDILTTAEAYDYRVRAYLANGDMVYSPYTNTTTVSPACE
jgi:hypothetical protein